MDQLVLHADEAAAFHLSDIIYWAEALRFSLDSLQSVYVSAGSSWGSFRTSWRRVLQTGMCFTHTEHPAVPPTPHIMDDQPVKGNLPALHLKKKKA